MCDAVAVLKADHISVQSDEISQKNQFHFMHNPQTSTKLLHKTEMVVESFETKVDATDTFLENLSELIV